MTVEELECTFAIMVWGPLKISISARSASPSVTSACFRILVSDPFVWGDAVVVAALDHEGAGGAGPASFLETMSMPAKGLNWSL